MTAVVLHKSHTRDVGHSVTNINHTLEWHRTLVLLHILVHLEGVIHWLYALVNLEDKLCLVGVVHRHSWPVGDAIDIVEERAGVDMLELVGDGCALDNLLHTRRVDVVQQTDASLGSIGIHTGKPPLHAIVIDNVASRLLERLTTKRQALALCLLNHSCHIGQNGVGILRLGKDVGIVPELLVALAHGGNKVILLHIAWRECAIEIVYQRYGLFHKN